MIAPGYGEEESAIVRNYELSWRVDHESSEHTQD